jgi:WbqC-like protein family
MSGSDRVVCTAHQPNFAPGMSVVSKIAASDVVVWLDKVQITKGGFTNRNRLPDGAWLTVPVEKHCAFKPINQVRIGNPRGDWKSQMTGQIRRAWGSSDVVESVCSEIMRPYGLLVGLNAAVLQVLLADLAPDCRWAWQSHLDAGHAVVAVSDDREELLPISDRLAMMTSEVGADIYLSGPSGRRYLDETPFLERGLQVEYWSWDGGNPCSLETASLPPAGRFADGGLAGVF